MVRMNELWLEENYPVEVPQIVIVEEATNE